MPVNCPFCKKTHMWTAKDAWVKDAPSIATLSLMSLSGIGERDCQICQNQLMIGRDPTSRVSAADSRAINKAAIAVAKDQNAGMKAAVNYDNLIDAAVEKRRLQYSYEKLIVSPEMKEIGIGDIRDDRMTRAIGIVVEGYQLARAPEVTEIFSREFLPPRKDRELIYTAN